MTRNKFLEILFYRSADQKNTRIRKLSEFIYFITQKQLFFFRILNVTFVYIFLIFSKFYIAIKEDSNFGEYSPKLRSLIVCLRNASNAFFFWNIIRRQEIDHFAFFLWWMFQRNNFFKSMFSATHWTICAQNFCDY